MDYRMVTPKEALKAHLMARYWVRQRARYWVHRMARYWARQMERYWAHRMARYWAHLIARYWARSKEALMPHRLSRDLSLPLLY